MTPRMVLSRRHVTTATLMLLTVLLALRVAWHLASGAGMFWDFVNFYNAGRRIYQGRFDVLYASPEPLAHEPPMPEGILTYVGFPLSAVVFAPLGAFGPRLALFAFKAACVGAFGLGVLVMLRHCRRRYGADWDARVAGALLLAAVLLWEPFWFSLTVGGQATTLAFPLLALALALHTRGRDWPAGAALGLAVLLKPFLAPMGLVLLLGGAWTLVFSVAATLGALGLLSLGVFGWPLHLQWVHAVLQESARWVVPWWNNASLSTLASNAWVRGADTAIEVTQPPAALTVLTSLIRLAAAAIVGARLFRARYASGESRAEERLLLALIFALCFSNVVWPHYLLFCLLPWMVLAARLPGTDWAGRVLVVLLLVSVARAQFTIARWMYTVVSLDTAWGLAVAGVLGAGTLLLLLAAVARGRFGDASSAAAR